MLIPWNSLQLTSVKATTDLPLVVVGVHFQEYVVSN